ncbi:MAG: LnmK family bifunctional acyltransferase/decarboxylase [Pyrinomonadaceae bacterium]
MTSPAVELQIKEIIARLTRVGVEKIDAARAASSYGIDSLAQLEFRELLERRFRVYLDDRTFNGFGSISELAAHIGARQTGPPPSPAGSDSETSGRRDAPGPAHPGKWRLTPSGVLYDDVEIGMSLTCLNNLAESPLLKYLGDLRWRHLSALAGVPSKQFADEEGRRLYPSFFYVEMVFPPHSPMAAYGENDRLKVSSTLKRYGGSMLDGHCCLLPADHAEPDAPPFDSVAASVAAGVPAVRLSNIFVEQHNGSEWLRTARPANPGFKTIPELALAPESYLTMKQAEKGDPLARPADSYVPMTDGLARVEYRLVVDRDFSSTGLVYFANYPVFLDICEREALASARLRLTEEMLDRRTLVRRRSAYLNNASPRDTLVVEVEPWVENPYATNHPAPEAAPVRLFVNYRMYRKSDGRLMMVSTAEKLVYGVPFAESALPADLLPARTGTGGA